MFIITLVVLYLFSFDNINIPSSKGINAISFILIFLSFYFVYIFLGLKLFGKKKIKSIALYSFLGYLFFLSLLVFFLSNILNGRDLYFTLNETNFSKEYILKGDINFTIFYIFNYIKDKNTFFGFIFNIICLIPFGFLLPLIFLVFEKRVNLFVTILIILISCILIEFLQFLLPINRVIDIDDVLSNFIGSLIGLAIFSIFKNSFSKSLTNI